MSGKDGDFLGRWSARKLKALAEGAPDPAPMEANELVAPPENVPEKTDAEILDELGLPDPDSLIKGDDFKAFLRAAVPARLRNRALRRLWISDPVLANLDGLNDYDQDFTDAATAMPVLKTAYRVGRGMLRDIPEPAEVDKAAPIQGAAEASAAPASGAGERGSAAGRGAGRRGRHQLIAG